MTSRRLPGGGLAGREHFVQFTRGAKLVQGINDEARLGKAGDAQTRFVVGKTGLLPPKLLAESGLLNSGGLPDLAYSIHRLPP